MKKLLIPLMLLTGCSASRWIPDQQMQVTLIETHKEFKSCGLPLNKGMGRTWHCDLKTKDGRIIPHHYFTESFAKQSWLVVGDKYTLQTDSRDSCGKYPYVYAILKHNK